MVSLPPSQEAKLRDQIECFGTFDEPERVEWSGWSQAGNQKNSKPCIQSTSTSSEMSPSKELIGKTDTSRLVATSKDTPDSFGSSELSIIKIVPDHDSPRIPPHPPPPLCRDENKYENTKTTTTPLGSRHETVNEHKKRILERDGSERSNGSSSKGSTVRFKLKRALRTTQGVLASSGRPLMGLVRMLVPFTSKSSNHSEDSPLLSMEEGRTSYDDGSFDDDDDMEQVPNETTLKAQAGWRKISHDVLSGNVLLRKTLQNQTRSAFADGDPRIWDDLDEEEKERRRERAHKRIQRGVEFNLLQCLGAIFLYIVVAVLAFSLVFDDLTIVDSVYFAMVTFTTIGYGDVVPPDNGLARFFTVVYAFSGVACLGVAIGILGTKVVETEEKAFRKTSEIAKSRIMSLFASSPEVEQDIQHTMEEQLEEGSVEQETQTQGTSGLFAQLLQTFMLVMVILFAFAFCVADDPGINASNNMVDSLYFTFITATTVGYGDMAPQTQRGRIFAIIFIPLTVGAMGHFLSVIATLIMESRRTSFQRLLETQELSLHDLELMDDNGDGSVEYAEFLEFMLKAMNKVDPDFIDEMRQYFKKLDVDGSGKLSKEDLVANARKKLHRTSKKLQLGVYKQNLLRRAQQAREKRVRGDSFWGTRLSFFNVFPNNQD